MPLQLLLPKARECEQVFYQVTHTDRVTVNLIQGIAGRLIELVGHLLHEHLDEAVHGAKRGAQIVRHRVGERLQLCCPLSDFHVK
jgi:hypothetical protein